jgi:N-acetylglucosaminyldiphosphoundecaprenol N-acetyl-beta-D-mannosaminyltransferase
VGGLFDHWAGRLRRAPHWVRSLGVEWVQLLLQQPHKWRRYLLGNPKFVARAIGSARAESTAR